MAAADMGDSLDAYDGDPAVMNTIKRALQSERLAPQWTEPDSPPPPPQQLQQLPPLREDELEELAARPEPALPFTERDRELLSRSISSLDYLGDWADPKKVVDSAVLMCTWPQLIQHPRAAPEFTCSYDDFQSERHQLHAHIIERMLKSAAKNGFDGRASLSSLAHSERINAIASASYSRPGRSATAPLAAPTGGPPAFPALSPGQQHVFIVVGVPGSGKDTVLKRFLQTLGLPLLDASADLVKEYLAAWGQDELSQEVRKNNAEHGPGKHLLHAQYLHRESILVIDRVVERALEQRKLLMLEKTLFNLEPVLEYAATFRERGLRVHLLGTHIEPMRNWEFLTNRMASGQSFGRFITKDQTLFGLRRYHTNLQCILSEPDLRSAFDSIHVYDVTANRWCVSLAEGEGGGGESPPGDVAEAGG